MAPPLPGRRGIPPTPPRSNAPTLPNRRGIPPVPPPVPAPTFLNSRQIELNSGMFPETVDLPKVPKRPVALYALIGTWFEGDVIEATVKNCFANGCQKVFLL